MYGWIWRILPFGTPGKIIGSLLLLAVAVWLLWFHVFPAAEPILPFDDVQLEGPNQPGPSGGGGERPDGDRSPTG